MTKNLFKEIDISEIKAKSFKLSPSLYNHLKQNNKSVKLRSLLSSFEQRDKGKEVGSHNYITDSPKKFMRTKALREESYLPQLSAESTESILPVSFIDNNLKKEDVLISKDSNIGEVVILDKDYPNYMMSAGINRLNIEKDKYYVFGVLKTDFFKQQLKRLASRGSTITHAKTLFLDCDIPYPNQQNSQDVINYVSELVSLIISKEKSLIDKKIKIDNIIDGELENKKSEEKFIFDYPSIKEMLASGRIDAGIYSEEFKFIDTKVKQYKKGYFFIDIAKINSGSTPRKRYISKDSSINLPYNWVTPTHINDYGSIAFTERIKCETNNLNEDCLLIVNRTSRGGRGEYVGVSAFYDYSQYGASHHNQGIYRITGYKRADLIFMGAFMNSSMMRKYCAGLSVGSKMKEIKSKQYSTIPFPKFEDKIKAEVSDLYYKESIEFLDVHEIVNAGKLRNVEAGIVQLSDDLNKLKFKVNEIVNSLARGEEIVL